ncbi:MAG: flippase-like domain-containing protein [Planctomycetes bacterium]|nr:flippase-like domain-containing protein [Planctomycetota bacterium]
MSESSEPHPTAKAASHATSLGQKLGHVWKWLKWPVAIGILVWMYLQNAANIDKILATPKSWGFAVLAFVLIGGSTLLTFARWYLLVIAQGFSFQFRDAIRYGFIGLVANYVAPGAVGGDLFKGVLLARDQSSRRVVAFATVLLDRVLGMLALFLVGACTLLIPQGIPDNPQLKLVTLLIWCGAGGGLLGLVVMLVPATTHWGWVLRLPRLPVVGKAIGELIVGVRLYQEKPRVVLAALGLSLLGHAGLITGFYFCALWMRQPWVPGLVEHFYFLPPTELFAVLIPTPGGVGALEEGVSWFYGQLRPAAVPQADALAAGATAGIAYRVVALSVAALGAVYYFTSRREISAAMAETTHTAE